jgi:ubiquinone/menaquinone biosynthesis C-methylase UbiE
MQKETYKFTNEDAENYDRYLGPVLFEPYGQYLASYIDAASVNPVLELASGTGRVTKHIHKVLPAGTEFWATDLNSDMLDINKRKLGKTNIKYQTGDIQNLSFADNAFDLVICQFGMMFLPDKQQGFNEICRVLKPGGKLLCFTWDSTLNNPIFKLLINELMMPHFDGEDNTRFFVPFSLYDPGQLAGWLNKAGFSSVETEKVKLNSGTASVENVKLGFYLKHPLGKAVKDKDLVAYEKVGQQFEAEVARRFGNPVSFPMSALLTVGVK